MKSTHILMVGLLIVAGCSTKSEKIKLALNLPVGYKQTLVNEQITKTSTLGSVNQLEEVTYKLDSIIGDSLYAMTGTMIRVKSQSNFGGETEDFDSNKKESEMTASEKEMLMEFKSVLNTDFNFVLNKRGEIVQHGVINNGLDQSLSSINHYKNLPLVYPINELEIGQEWKEDTERKEIIEVKTHSTYKVTKIEGDKVFIAVAQKIEKIGNLLGENTTKGECIVDKKTGILIKYVNEMQMQVGGGTLVITTYPKD